MRMAQQQPTTLRFEARNADELRRKVGSRTIQSGDTGRIEVYAVRIGPVCPVPLGPLMGLPGAGTIWASALTPAGATVVDRGGIGVCDAFVGWAIPIAQQQEAGRTRMGAVFAVVAIALAIAAALGALGWAISRLVLILRILGPSAAPVAIGVVVLGLALVFGAVGSRRRKD